MGRHPKPSTTAVFERSLRYVRYDPNSGAKADIPALLVSANNRPSVGLQAKSVIDPTADDALVEFDRNVGNYGCPAYVSDRAISNA